MKHTWADFAKSNAEMAAFGEVRLKATAPSFLGTVSEDGLPRVHPVTPIIGEGHLLLFMNPTSPKGRDLQRGSGYALHCSVTDDTGGSGEFYCRGHAELNTDPAMRELAAKYGYAPQPRYILFELSVESAHTSTYPDGADPIRKRWSVT